jgi:uncharacterized membrane protein (DUF2068 family)
MYQPYPSGRQPTEPIERPQPPSSVLMAVRFMYAGAAVSAISLVISLATVGNLRASLHRAAPKLTPSQLHSAEIVLVSFSVISALIGVGLWIWMARMNRAGKNWARIAGTVLFGLETLLLVLGLGRAGAAAGSLFAILPWLIGLGAVVFLWRRDSTEYFNANRGG